MNRFGVIAVLLLAACSSEGASTQEPEAVYRRLLDDGRCQAFRPEPDKELFVREQGTCDSDDGPLTIYTFSGKGQDQWLEVAQGFGGSPMVVGDRWVVVAQSQTQAEAVAETLAGDVR